MNWKLVNQYVDGTSASVPWFECEFKHGGKMYLEPRPHYCDRGNWYAKCELRFDPKFPETHIDGSDGWPRYYFDLERAKLELEAWINKRGLAP